MGESKPNIQEIIIYPLIFLGIFVLLLAISAEVDWYWDNGLYGTTTIKELAYVWLFAVLLPVILIIGWLVLKKLPITEEAKFPKNDKKKFIWSIIIILIIQNMMPIFYIFFDRDQLSTDLIMAVLFIVNFVIMAALAAYFPVHPEMVGRTKRWLLFFLLGVVPFYALIGGLIGGSWAVTGDMQGILKLIYWIIMWGVLMPLSFVFLGVSWKNRTGAVRKSFNIALAGIIFQYSFLEDILFYALNGQPQPTSYNALLNMPIDLARLFGHQGVGLTPAELFLWSSLMICLAVVVIFDIPFLIYKKIRKN